ncbi:MAG: electron transport complex subunit RsxC [Candidatus Hadarchaeales archaeon]
MFRKFKGGIKLPHLKPTAGFTIERMKLPSLVVVPLKQHIGAVCEPLVQKGEKVKTGQKIGDSHANLSAPVHSPISGVVKEVRMHPIPTGEEVPSIFIESDGVDEWVETSGIDPEKAGREEILSRIREAGIVGLGGAAFPTHVKLNPPKKVDTLIINGCEGEPFITADHRLMLEYPERIMRGVEIMMKVCGAERAIIAIEEDKRDAEQQLKKFETERIKIAVLPSRYPQGDERHLIKALLRREVPAGGLPFDVGVVVQNVATAKAVADAILDGKPLIERIVTVTGAVRLPKNLLVRIGTLFSALIEECGGPAREYDKIVAGGPMMGFAQWCDIPVIKGTNCVLLMKSVEDEERDCIRCGRCVDVCPMGLEPTILASFSKKKMFDKCLEYRVTSCDECGCCAYVCPSKIPLVQYIKLAKDALRRSA